MHPAALPPGYDCKCVLWQPSKHNVRPQLSILWYFSLSCILALRKQGDGLVVVFFFSWWAGPAGWQTLFKEEGETVPTSSASLHTRRTLPSYKMTLRAHYTLSIRFPCLKAPGLSLRPIQCNICCRCPHTRRLIIGGGERRENNRERERERVSQGEREGERGKRSLGWIIHLILTPEGNLPLCESPR